MEVDIALCYTVSKGCDDNRNPVRPHDNHQQALISEAQGVKFQKL